MAVCLVSFAFPFGVDDSGPRGAATHMLPSLVRLRQIHTSLETTSFIKFRKLEKER